MCALQQELMISNNNLDTLPDTINQLNNLELLDVANNQLSQIQSISCMTNLRILNISGNSRLLRLPIQLSTCDSLVDIVLDADTMEWPPANVCDRGAVAILNYLTTDGKDSVDNDESCPAIKTITESAKESTNIFLSSERNAVPTVGTDNRVNNDKLHRGQLLEQERLAAEKNVNLEAELHTQQQKRKQVVGDT